MIMAASSHPTPTRTRRRLRWLWISLGVIAALVATPFIVGRFMPRDFTGRAELTIPRPIDEVWASINDVTRSPIAAGMARGSERLADVDGRVSWREDLGSSSITYRVLDQSAPSRRVIEGRDSVVPMTLRATCELTPVEGGTRVRVEHNIHLDDGTWHVPVFRFMLSVAGGAQSGAAQYLKSLERARAGD
jgi:hypothetical protein